MHARERRIGIILLVVALALVGGAAGYVFASLEPEISRDADRCPPAPAGTWLVAIDNTDVLPEVDKERITKGIHALAARMRANERLALHVVTGDVRDAAAPRPVPGLPLGFRRCKPQDPAHVNPLVQNERFIRAAYEREFLAPLTSTLPHLMISKAVQSPILESLEAMMWSPAFQPNVPVRWLVIYSDLIENTPLYSHRRTPALKACAVLASPIGERLRRHDWRGVKVILEPLRNARDAAIQGPGQLRFWSQLLYALGAEQVFNGPTLIANDAPACLQPQRRGRLP